VPSTWRWLLAVLLQMLIFSAASSSADQAHVGRQVAEGEPQGQGSGAAVTGEPVAPEGDVAITPEFAQVLFDRLAPLREADGCRLQRFDTSRSRITVGLQGSAGAESTFEIAPAPARIGGGCATGTWVRTVPPELRLDCGATLAAIDRVLEATPPPRGARQLLALPSNYTLLGMSFILLVLGTLHVLYREVRTRRPSPSAVLAIVLVWGAALALRLLLSPRTFLHEYYHIAETISGYLTGEIAPGYGNTGPALFRLMGAVFGRPDDVQVIFLTNAVLASLAIPAVALLDFQIMGSWPRALCAAVLLCVLPQHLRFSAAEDLFVQAVTFGLWTLALFALYLRTRRLEDAVCTALALSLAMQTRPEMLVFPVVLMAFVVLVEPRAWRALCSWPALLALLILAALLTARFFDAQQALHGTPWRVPLVPDLRGYLDSLVFFHEDVTPVVYWILLAVGLAWGMRHKPGFLLWVMFVFFGYALLSLSSVRFPSRVPSKAELLGNPVYNLRSQLLPTSFVVLIAAGTASVWMAVWGHRRRLAFGVGAGVLVALGAIVVVTSRRFVTELRDQQLEWAFLERTVPELPERARLLSAIDVGGTNLDAFPQLLLQGARKTYTLVDVAQAASGAVAWPTPDDDLIYYQGMFCHFTLHDRDPDSLAQPCRAVHERYILEPLFVEDLDAEGYSMLPYGHRPFRIGFFRLRAAR
jgi:hypothetical protein